MRVVDTNRVTHVLMADGWHVVMLESFDVGSYDFVEGERDLSSLNALGATWRTVDGFRVYCLLTSVLAVKQVEAAR